MVAVCATRALARKLIRDLKAEYRSRMAPGWKFSFRLEERPFEVHYTVESKGPDRLALKLMP